MYMYVPLNPFMQMLQHMLSNTGQTFRQHHYLITPHQISSFLGLHHQTSAPTAMLDIDDHSQL